MEPVEEKRLFEHRCAAILVCNHCGKGMALIGGIYLTHRNGQDDRPENRRKMAIFDPSFGRPDPPMAAFEKPRGGKPRIGMEIAAGGAPKQTKLIWKRIEVSSCLKCFHQC